MSTEMKRALEEFETLIARELEAGLIDGRISARNFIEENRRYLRFLIERASQRVFDEHGNEIRRWQDKIRDTVIEASGAPDSRIDGCGCDSGNPLDVTLAEIAAGFNFMQECWGNA